MSSQVFFAPIGADPRDLTSWTSVPVMDATFNSAEDVGGVLDAYGYPLAGFSSTLKLSFTMSRRDMRRVMKLIPRTKADLRRSAMHSAYRRRRRTR